MGKLYTGFGDKGYTQTANSRHISKSDTIIELLGTVDEFTSQLGAAKAYTSDNALAADIEQIQKKLISVMGEIAGGAQSVTEECAARLEQMCDKYSGGALGEFTLPGKNIVSAQLDIARTVVRRAERIAVKAAQTGRVKNTLLVYINRLSDVMYAMSQYAAKEQTPEIKGADGGSGVITLDMAKEIAYAVESAAEQMNKRIVVAITDKGANLILLHSMDDAYIASCRIAQDKAYTSAALKMPTHVALAESRGGKLDGLDVTDTNRLSLLGGGYPLVANGQLLGGIGVSGGTAEEDTQFAEIGALYTEKRFQNK